MKEQDAGSLGTAVSGDPVAPPSTSNTDLIWHVNRWASDPTPYAVTQRTAKTLRVKQASHKGYMPSHERRVVVSQMGREWFASEDDAWRELHVRALEELEDSKRALQSARSDLGRIASEMQRRGIAVSVRAQTCAGETK